MIWHTWKWWRLAIGDSNASAIWDADGKWTRLVGPLWILRDREERTRW
jgi:hypothetical protein